MDCIKTFGYSWDFILGLTKEQAKRLTQPGYQIVLEREEIQSLIKAGELTIEEILSLGWEACLCLSDEKVMECIQTFDYSWDFILGLTERAS